MNSEPNDPVWDLLEKAPPKAASPMFSRNVIREIRRGESPDSPRTGFLAAFFNLRVLGSAAAAVVALGFAFQMFNSPEGYVQTEPEVTDQDMQYAEVLAEELEVMAFVDELLSVSDPSQLNDDALAELLF